MVGFIIRSLQEGSETPKRSTMKTSVGVTLWILAILLTLSIVSAKPTEIRRHKRQSDQRIAELETLLALQKYGQHRLREWGRGRELAPGYGLIDFDKIGRRKKSTRFSPGEDDGEGRYWKPSSWLLPLTTSQQQNQNLSSRNSPNILEVDQK